VGLAALGVLLSYLHWARADASKINLSILGCDASGVSADRLFELARTELAPRLLAVSDGSPKADELNATVHLCLGSTHHALLVLGIEGQRSSERLVDLSDVVGDLRTRTLAVALAEFVASAPASPTMTGANAGNTSPPAATQDSKGPGRTVPQNIDVVPSLSNQESATTASSRRAGSAHSTRLSAGLALREFFAPQTRMFGPWISMTGNRWTGELIFLASNTTSDQPQGTVSLYDANLAGAYEFVTLGERPQVGLRLRGELGWVWASGRPKDQNSVQGLSSSAPQYALLLELLLKGAISRKLGIETRLTCGAAGGLTAQADKQAVATTNGFLVGGTLGLFYDWASNTP
jgi:hypothetical protein